MIGCCTCIWGADGYVREARADCPIHFSTGPDVRFFYYQQPLAEAAPQDDDGTYQITTLATQEQP